jgi:hypothetical protein
MERVEFRDWHILVDREKTVYLYTHCVTSFVANTKCIECRNFVLLRDDAYPADLMTFFAQLGIDPFREVEVDHYQLPEHGRAQYYVELWFVGRLLDDHDTPLEPMPYTERDHIPFTALTPDVALRLFQMGTRTGQSESPGEWPAGPYVMLECQVWVPWVIEEDSGEDA